MRVPRIIWMCGIAASLLTASGRAAAQTPNPGPTMTLSIAAAASGQSLDVEGAGWPATVRVTIMVCGQDATETTAACDVLGGQTVVTDLTGGFRTPLTIRVPPVPCPCAVWASSPSSGIDATSPVAIVAAPYTPPAEPSHPTSPSIGPVSTDELVTPAGRDLGPWASVTWLWVVGLPTSVVVAVALIALQWHRRPGVRQPQPAHRARSASATLSNGLDPIENSATALEEPPGTPGEVSTEGSLTPSAGKLLAPSSERGLVPVEFSLSDAGNAQSVSLCGDFNDWAPGATRLHFLGERWTATLLLEPGRAYRYRYLIDGERWVRHRPDVSALPNPFDPFEAEDFLITVTI